MPDLINFSNLTGDALRNYNSFEYLRSFKKAITDCLHSDIKFPPTLKSILEAINTYTNDYNPNYAYGNLYTKFLTNLEATLPALRKQHEQNNKNVNTIDNLIHCIYYNENHALENTEKAIESIVATTIQTHKSIESNVTKQFSKGKPINQETPQSQGSTWSRATTTLSSNYKPQFITNIPSVRQYEYNQKSQTVELRFGTQGQRHKGVARVSPLFELWLTQQRKHSSDQNQTNPQGKDAITHLYINNLGLDRSGFEGKRERALTSVLHDLENTHPNIAVITLPADKGIMSRKLLNERHEYDSTTAKTILKQIATRPSKPDKDTDLSAFISDDRRDFYISDTVKKRLGEKVGYEKTIDRLIDNAFRAMGIMSKQSISAQALQAVFFHFIKFELTEHIKNTLAPKTMNFSCKDAIDRGGVSSAYYNLIKSITDETPMSRAEFERALHAAPALVKGRGMNHHVQLIWNAIDAYLDNPSPEYDIPIWLFDWRMENASQDNAKSILDKTIHKTLDDLKKLASSQPASYQPLIEQAIRTLENTQQLSQRAKPKAYSTLYQTALQTKALVEKTIVYLEALQNNPSANTAFTDALERYKKTYQTVKKRYSGLAEAISNFIKHITKIFNKKIKENLETDKAAKGLIKEHKKLFTEIQNAQTPQTPDSGDSNQPKR